MLAIYDADANQIVHHDDDGRFHSSSEDVEILSALHREDPEWIFVGGDGRILRNKAELAVLAELNLTYLLFNRAWCNKPIEDTCWMLIKGWPNIVRQLEGLKVHSILELAYGSNGKLDNRGPTRSFRQR